MFFEMTQAELEGRRQVWQMYNFLKERVAGFENAYIIAIGAQIGVRESRRIIGDYVMTDEDILEGHKFEDGIALNNYPIDIHNPAGTGTVIKRLKKGDFYSVPYRSLIPKKVGNLLVGGTPHLHNACRAHHRHVSCLLQWRPGKRVWCRGCIIEGRWRNPKGRRE